MPRIEGRNLSKLVGGDNEFPMPKGLKSFPLNDNIETILQKRYLRKDEHGIAIETPEELFWRVASSIAMQDFNYGVSNSTAIMQLAVDFYELMVGQIFLPNSPTLMNAGKLDGQLSACFVLPIGDSIEEIFDAIKYAALIHKSGGGTGFSFSRLRPKDSTVKTTGGIASGPLSFLKIFDTATEQIKQGGTRRGANMGILRIDHPDIIEFIKAKEVEGNLNNFNLSVAITDEFMQALKQPRSTYNLVDPHTGNVTGKLVAQDVWELLVDRAWKSGDPGIVFIDSINKDNPTPELGAIEATNPCGEQPLLSYEACNLGSINLCKFIKNKRAYSAQDAPRYYIDWTKLTDTVRLAVHFLDNVIDANCYPLPEIAHNVAQTRKIGLGVMGWADLLFQLNVAYDDTRATVLAEEIMSCINKVAHEASQELAQRRGCYPAYNSRLDEDRELLRNATVTTIAPTGSLSIIANCSSGIEPIFALCFTKNILDGEKFTEYNPYFRKALAENPKYNTKEILDFVAQKGSIRNTGTDVQFPEHLSMVFATAMDIDPIWHLRMQAAFQKNTDNAVSKTINLPNSATRKDIDDIYRQSYALGCKGITVYRDGCKSIQVLNTGEGQQRQEGKQPQSATELPPEAMQPQKRPNIMQGFTEKVRTGHGVMYLTINEINGKPFEVFATISKSGHSIMAKAEAIGRLVSLALRSGIDVKSIITQLKGIGGERPIFLRKHSIILSIPDAIAWVLEKHYLDDGDKVAPLQDLTDCCPDCGGKLVLQEGCQSCPSCGYSKCN